MVVFGLVTFLIAFTAITVQNSSGNTVQLPTSINLSETKQLSPIFTSSVQHWSLKILTWSDQYGVDPNLIATVMQIESCGNPQAQSSAGASGLFQVMPFHFAESENPFDPDTNAYRGIEYLSSSLSNANGDAGYALAGYNGGIGIISTDQAYWAEETIDYMYWGSGIYNDAVNGLENSPRLQEWLNAGGYSLCSSAQLSLGLP